MYTASEFAALHARHAAEVTRAATEVLRDSRLAEDVAQDVFLSLWRDARHDPGRGPLGPYLRALARNRAVDVWRRNRSRQRTAERYADASGSPLASASDVPHEAVVHRFERAAAREAVDRLPADQRRAIGLAYWGGLSASESAELQGIPLGTAKSRIRLALHRLADDPAIGRVTARNAA
jgi:RNA polymerase sigma factor (sigma-70 family)